MVILDIISFIVIVVIIDIIQLFVMFVILLSLLLLLYCYGSELWTVVCTKRRKGKPWSKAELKLPQKEQGLMEDPDWKDHEARLLGHQALRREL